jgi:protein O-mannosyl-transferase
LIVAFLAVSAYANSLANGFALDDEWFIVQNEVVSEQRYAEAFSTASWPGATPGTGNYRPVVLSSLALEWSVWGDEPLGFHSVNVAVHALVSLLVLALLTRWLPLVPATVGAAFFAIHPVHTEAVANVMGRSELYAAGAYLGACLLYLGAAPRSGAGRGARLMGLLALFALALGSKEIAVTLPALLIALELFRDADEPLGPRLRREAPTYVTLFALLGCYLLVRWSAIGAFTGESAAAGLASLGTDGRLLSALTVWPQYLRLIAFPLDLSADYSPAVLIPTSRVTVEVVLGLALLGGAIAAAVAKRGLGPALSLGFAWFVLTLLPVSNLIVRADVLLAERTLYLPSVGASLVVAALAAWLLDRVEGVAPRRVIAGMALVAAALLFTRTVTRNPAWASTQAFLSTLGRDHPESWMAQRAMAAGFEQAGNRSAAGEAWERAMLIAPDRYDLLVEVARFHEDDRDVARADRLLERAIQRLPNRPEAYRIAARFRLLRGDGRGAHAMALRGLAAVGADRDLWALVSESYVMKGDVRAAVRARTASLAAGESAAGRRRLADLLDLLGRPEEAAVARRHVPEAPDARR